MALQKDLHDRLNQLEQKLSDMKTKLEFKSSFHGAHQLTNGELMARHEFLKRALEEEIADFEQQGHHVSALEQDTINWINGIDKF
jgi:uncharacterized damage-inducible protein DinB